MGKPLKEGPHSQMFVSTCTKASLLSNWQQDIFVLERPRLVQHMVSIDRHHRFYLKDSEPDSWNGPRLIPTLGDMDANNIPRSAPKEAPTVATPSSLT